jgi:hypothetical protein
MRGIFLVLAWLVVALAIFAAPFSCAGSESDPEMVDPTGDVMISPGIGVAPTPSMLADAVDIVKVWFHDETGDTISATMKMLDLNKLANTDFDPQTDVMYIIRFHTSFSERNYELRADYSTKNWEYNLEIYESDNDGYADYLPINGSADFYNSFVTFVVPLTLIENPLSGDRLTMMESTAQMVFPAYPVYSVDWASGSTGKYGREYTFQNGTKFAISVNCVPINISVTAGENASFTISVQNDGDQAKNVSLRVNGVQGWDSSFITNKMHLAAHTQNSTQLIIHVPENAVNGSVKITILASSDSEISSCNAYINVARDDLNPGQDKTENGKNDSKTPGFDTVLSMVCIFAAAVLLNGEKLHGSR